jgi:hypothetical protein
MHDRAVQYRYSGYVPASVEVHDEAARRFHLGPVAKVDWRRLRRARLDAHLTIAAAALVTSLERRTLMRLEGWGVRYRSPAGHLATLERLATVYGVELAEVTAQ